MQIASWYEKFFGASISRQSIAEVLVDVVGGLRVGNKIFKQILHLYITNAHYMT